MVDNCKKIKTEGSICGRTTSQQALIKSPSMIKLGYWNNQLKMQQNNMAKLVSASVQGCICEGGVVPRVLWQSRVAVADFNLTPAVNRRCYQNSYLKLAFYERWKAGKVLVKLSKNM